MAYYSPPIDILQVILSHNLTIPTIIDRLLEGGCHDLRDDLLKNASNVLNALYCHQPDTIFSWAFDVRASDGSDGSEGPRTD